MKIKNKSFFLVMAIVTIVLLNNFRIYKNPTITSWDVFGYYSYLPQTFIEHDPGFKNIEHIHAVCKQYDFGSSSYQFLPASTGNCIPKYTFGLSLLNSPAFLMGHAWAKIGGYVADGYSYPYQMSLVIWNIILTFISLLILYKVFLHFFSKGISSFLIAVLFFTTNYFVYCTLGLATPHSYLLLLYAILLLVTIKWHEQYKIKFSFFIGITVGLLTLCRPSEFISILIPVLWKIRSWQDFKARIKLFSQLKNKDFVFISLGIFICIFPQLLYWKMYAGEFFHFAYKDPGEGFEFAHPHLLEFLFGFRKGWFVYTPIMIFAVLGLIYGLFKRKENSGLFFIFMLLNIYILSSWTCWWYATSFGQRSMIQTFPIYLIGLGYLVQLVLTKGKVLVISFFTLVSLITALNLFQIWQAQMGIIDLSRMTKPYYFAVFGKTMKPKGVDDLLLIGRDLVLKDSIPQANKYVKFKTWKVADHENESKPLNISNKYSPAISFRFDEATYKDHAWLKISFDYTIADTLKDIDAVIIAHFTSKSEKAYDYQCIEFTKQKRVNASEFTSYHVYYLSPQVRLPSDKFRGFVWLRSGKGTIKIRNFKVESFVRKD